MLNTISARVAAIVACAGIFAACSSGTQSPIVPQSQTGAQTPARSVAAVAQHRSLADFLAVQGTYCVPPSTGVPPGAAVINGCVLYVPPNPNFNGWGVAPSTPFCSFFTTAAIDYAGIINTWLVQNGHPSLGTTTSGSVTEKRMPDGSGQVIVNISTHNALAWGGCDPNFDFATATVLFGNTPNAVLAGATPALANSTYRIVYSEPQFGVSPFMDLIAIGFQVNGYHYITQQFFSSASGPLHNAFENVPNGTPGQMVVGQNGLFKTVGKAAADGFTAEFVKISTK